MKWTDDFILMKINSFLVAMFLVFNYFWSAELIYKHIFDIKYIYL